MAVEFAYRLKENGRLERVTAMFVRINSYEGRVACGVLRSMVREEPIPFQGLDQMLLLIEEILDKENVRMSSKEYRYLEDDKEDIWLEQCGKIQQEVPHKKPKQHYLNALLKIYGRQNRSLQGELNVSGKKVYFRSGMELLRLLHQALWREYQGCGQKKIEQRQKVEITENGTV